jgi:ATP-dependent DNA helicase RecG
LDILDKKFLIAKISYEGLHRVEQWEYPYEAVRETIINAIVHRDYMGAPIQISVYDDKIIVWNEGSLPNDLTIDDLKEQHSSRPHNPILASSFFKGGLIEAWGRGTVKIINECKNAGLPEPKIENVFGGIQVTLFKNLLDKTKLIELGLNIRQIKAIEHLKEYGEITNSKYQKINSISKATATRDLTELVEKYKLTEKKGETGIGTFYELKGLKKGS